MSVFTGLRTFCDNYKCHYFLLSGTLKELRKSKIEKLYLGNCALNNLTYSIRSKCQLGNDALVPYVHKCIIRDQETIEQLNSVRITD